MADGYEIGKIYLFSDTLLASSGMQGSPLQVGDIVADAYAVEKIIGAGGMAVVALAAHVEYRHRVAIKILRPENSRRQEVVKRFERERRTLTMLHSEHTLRIYGMGQHAGLPYMMIEYLQGKDLAELIKAEGPLPIELAVEYILHACHALAEAHLLGVVHRDLKPGNLFLTRRTDGSPCIKVLDFGIAKQVAADAAGEASFVTKTSAIMGSPFYMSPEQMVSSTNVDHRTDIWSLGVTLYELLTKALPFAADSGAEVCRRIMKDAPTPLRKLRPTYPKGLEQTILRCLDKRPEQRFQNVADLALRLADFGPSHGQFAVQAICELIAPTEPMPVSDGTVDEPTIGGHSPSATTGDTTVYLPHGESRVGGLSRTSALLGTAAIAFALGVGVGWALNLNTDPTRAGAFAATPSKPAAKEPGAAPVGHASSAAVEDRAAASAAASGHAIDLDSRPAFAAPAPSAPVAPPPRPPSAGPAPEADKRFPRPPASATPRPVPVTGVTF